MHSPLLHRSTIPRLAWTAWSWRPSARPQPSSALAAPGGPARARPIGYTLRPPSSLRCLSSACRKFSAPTSVRVQASKQL